MQFAWGFGLAASLVCGSINAATAQGAIGGSLGKQDKSISGSADEGDTRSSSRERSRSKRSGTSASGGSGNFDGKWNAASVGNACGASGVITISGGQLFANDTTGRVTSSGSLSGSSSSQTLSSTFSGRLS